MGLIQKIKNFFADDRLACEEDLESYTEVLNHNNNEMYIHYIYIDNANEFFHWNHEQTVKAIDEYLEHVGYESADGDMVYFKDKEHPLVKLAMFIYENKDWKELKENLETKFK